MDYNVIEPNQFLKTEMFRQDDFLDGIARHNWEQYRGLKILVSGCGDTITPPWAFMVIASRLVGIARSVRYGNEHDNVVVYRESR